MKLANIFAFYVTMPFYVHSSYELKDIKIKIQKLNKNKNTYNINKYHYFLRDSYYSLLS